MKLEAGSKIGLYSILEPIGSGGMGEVYRAHDPQLGRDAVIKVLPEHIAAQGEALARLENEARLASSLNHPNIVTIYSIGWDGSYRYIAMEFINGPTLQNLIDAGPMPIDQAISIAAQIADGLAKAHEAGIIHRDLKPKNVMLTKDGVAKILDFGLSKLAVSIMDPEAPTPTFVDPEDGFTKPGTILGTVEYMSPEQAAGRPLDFRSDQFSMGSLIYALVTGRKPFHRETTVQTLNSIIEAEAQPVSQIVPQVPPTLETIIRRCMMKDPAERYASTKDLARDLRELELIRKAPARHWTRREWIRATLAIILALAAGGGLWLWFQRPYQPNPAALPWYQRGQSALHSMTFDSARKAFEQAVRADPKFALAHAGLAISYDLLDYSDLANRSMLRASSMAEETRLSADDQMRLQALRYVISRDYDTAAPLMEKLERDAGDPDKPAAALESGWLAEKREDTNGAAAAYKRAVIMNPGYAAARLRLGFIQQRLGQDKDALESFTEAENLYNATSDLEGRTEVLYQHASLLNRRNRVEEAMPLLRTALEVAHAVGSRYQEIRLQLLQSAVTRKLGRREEARKLAEDAINAAILENMDNISTSGMISLGGVYQTSGDFEAADRSFARALDIAGRRKVPKYEALASLSLASLSEQKGQPEEALRFVKAAMPLFTQAGYRRELAQAMCVRGGALSQMGELDQGLKVLREALPIALQIRDARTEVQVRDRIAENLQDQGVWPEALQESERSAGLQMSQPSPYARINSAGLYWRLGRRQDAENILSAIEQTLRENESPQTLSTLRFRKAELLYGEDRFEQAKAYALEAISAMPKAGYQIGPDAKLIVALTLIRAGQRNEGIQSALQIIQDLEKDRLAGKAASAQLLVAEALAGSKGDLAGKLALQALAFFEQHAVWESIWRCHMLAARVSGKAEAEKHRNAAHSALAELEKLWPSGSMDSYLQRPNIKMLLSALQSQ